jgi:hypothetical protein
MKLKLLSLFTLLFLVTISRAQDLINLVPKDAAFAAVLDINQINTKLKFEELTNIRFIEKMSKEKLKDMVKADSTNYLNLKNYGIQLNSKAYFYFKSSDKVYYGALLIALDDEAKFAHLVKLAFGDAANIITRVNYKYAAKKDIKIVWNNKSAAFWSATISPAQKDSLQAALRVKYIGDESKYLIPPPPPPAFGEIDSIKYTDNNETVVESAEPVQEETFPVTSESSGDSYAVTDSSNIDNYTPTDYSAYDRMYAAVDLLCDSIKNVWCTSNTGVFLKDKGINSLAGNKEFADYIKNNPDGAFVFDYGMFTKLYMSSMWKSALGGAMADPYKFVDDIYGGLTMYAKAEFKKDDISISFDMKYGSKLNEIYKEIKKKKISSNFLKYMDKDLMGYYAIGIDIPGYSKGIGHFLREVMPSIPQYGDIAVSAMDVIDIFIDEQAIYKLFTGDMVLAVNGVKPIEVIHTSYDYDENYNRTEKTDTTTQMQPEIQFMMGVGNITDVNKILKLLINLKVLRQEGNLYCVEYNHNPLPVYISIHDGILFVGNNKADIAKPVIYPKDKQLDDEHTKLFSKNTFVAYASMNNIAKYFVKEGSDKMQRSFMEVAGMFSDIKIYSGHQGNHGSTKFMMKLTNTEDNSMLDLIKFFNALYVINGDDQERGI